ncbi:32610_t:CDS:2 [Gigaspora margarita]|uniref:32610_t:CDS:1 n=1 Tax=Gigaspora margarita TaxID=4874 RepID=A0ABN7VHP2_GIGMA|nr:32610_t:CDS:2 [Gigaspora margarita]
MEEFVLKASFDDEEANNDSNQMSGISIVAEHHEEAFMSDWQSLEKGTPSRAPPRSSSKSNTVGISI